MRTHPSKGEIAALVVAVAGAVLFFAGGTFGLKLIGMWTLVISAGVFFWLGDGPLIREIKRRFRGSDRQ
jgi:hypothetical protein